ncbi:MAG: hypothetical protein RL685_816 [Pseudomonadota bacterium]|jgi:hypothetical protein
MNHDFNTRVGSAAAILLGALACGELSAPDTLQLPSTSEPQQAPAAAVLPPVGVPLNATTPSPVGGGDDGRSPTPGPVPNALPPPAVTPGGDVCATDAGCDSVGSSCMSNAGDPLQHCARNCDLVTANEPRVGLQACGEGLRCTFVPDAASAGHADCSEPPPDGFEGSTCERDAQCLPSLNCFRERCAVACNADASTCASGLKCGGVKQLAGQEVGSCCSVPVGQTCDLVTDCGCGPEETCTIVNYDGETRCRVVSESAVPPYSGCTSEAECPARHSCVGTPAGACRLRCNSVADCGSEGSSSLCAPALDSDDNPIAGLSFCSRDCDVLSPQRPGDGLRECGPGATCDRVAGPPIRIDCVGEGTGIQGDSCSTADRCASGFGCHLQHCERWCEPASGSCDAGLVCSGGYDVAGRVLGTCCQLAAGKACDWVTDCGCGPGETCAVVGDAGQTQCIAVSNSPVAPYADCTRDDQCPARHSCSDGACKPHCAADTDCPEGDSCLRTKDDGDPNAGFSFCARSCDLVPPEGRSACCQLPAGEVCDWTTDCGCSAGNTCARNGTGVRSCRAINEQPAEPYAACSADSECPAKHTCAAGNCMQRCLKSSPCPDRAACILFSAQDDEGVCGRTCDVLTPQAPATGFRPCAPGFTCVLAKIAEVPGIAEANDSYCVSAGAIAAGGDCTDTSDCSTSLTCDQGLCRQYCDPATDGCPSGTTCTPNDALPIVRGRSLGLCLPD